MTIGTQTKSQGPGRPKDMEKRAAILAAAKGLFIRNAFAGTSMDAIATDAGVSKLTVYSHFGDKDNLFREVIRARIHDLLPESLYAYDPHVDIGVTLLGIAQAHMRMDCEADNVGTIRAILSDCRQGNPRYGKLLWEEGPARTHHLMERLLQQAVDDGALEIPVVKTASVQFFSLIKGDLLLRRLFACDECPVAAAVEIEEMAHTGVDTFLRAYRPR
ncbi:MAG TPA: TetR/AcrR family transcriptional regulator [Rhodanobacter sp.]|nr:TetR/AcrR family transcriptional regulator [Rhodanobacter sp.]